jgi:hypothetical protein
MRQRIVTTVLAGILGAVLVQLQIVLLWGPVYSHYPHKGYEWAMSQGITPRYFTDTRPGVEVALAILFIVGVIALWRRRQERWKDAAGFAGGAWFGLTVWGLFHESFRESNLLPLGLVFLLIVCCVPTLAAWGATALLGARTRPA